MNKKHTIKISFIVLAIIVSGYFVYSQTKGAVTLKQVSENGLLGYWSLNDGSGSTVTDFSGNGNHGTLTYMDPATDWVQGRYGKALDFDGYDDYVAVAGNPRTAITISAWVKSTADSVGDVLSKNRGYGDQHWELRRDDLNDNFCFLISKDGYNSTYDKCTSANSFLINTWYHVVATYDQSYMRVYINGVEDTGGDLPFALSGNIYDLGPVTKIGARYTGVGTAYHFTGVIDEVRLYERALSATEVGNLYKQGVAKLNISRSKGSIGDGLVGHWTFDGPDMTSNVADVSGSGNNGYLNGTFATATSTATNIGKIGQALSFNGSDDHISIGNAGSGIKTISFWIKASDITSRKVIDIDGTDQIEISAGSDILATSFPAATIYVDAVVASAVDTEWHHVVIVDSTGVNASALDIGRVSTGYFNGKLDDVRIYNRALSQAEITRLYNQGAVALKVQTTDKVTLNTSLVGHWTFDGPDMTSNVADVSGSGNNGYLNGTFATATSTATNIGKIGQALSFNGTSNNVVTQDASSLDISGTSPISISAWIKLNSFPTGVSPQYMSAVMTTETGVGATIFDKGIIVNDSQKFEFYFYDGSSRHAVSTTIASLGEWYHIVGEFNGSQGIIYVNGVQENTQAGSSTYDFASPQLLIGGRTGGSVWTKYFDGQIDDVRIYNRALSASEVQRLYNMGR